ncbi:MAG TPA: murein biosynthesis integral membrane protein MurJ [Candidatus Binataceae bacterium]|nr:murein biosynthesis integral membrane protein MurJ [Candidatus Binataceae bacterium]
MESAALPAHDAAVDAEAAKAASNPTPVAAGGAGLVASGILLSRIAGVIRESVFAHYLGNSAAADAFKAGFRIPNILQNLLGEGVLSASFIPVYSRLLGEGEEEMADLLAWAFGAVLLFAVSALVAIGMTTTPYLITAIAPGFEAERRTLAIEIVRVLFPCTGLLVMSAWCLGVLNSHHKFFMSYAAGVAFNVAMIATLIFYGSHRSQDALAVDLAWGCVVGAALQILVQMPQVLMILRKLRIDFARVAESLRAVFRNLGPVVMSRGVGQFSAYVDNFLASWLPIGAVSAFNYGQIFYMLPVSLFGLSVAAAELPSMSRATALPENVEATLRRRLNFGLRQIAFLVVPSAAAFFSIGDVIVASVFQSGHFGHRDAVYVWAVLAGSGVGMLASTMGRLYNSAFYALWDTKTPFKFAAVRVALSGILGYIFAIPLPRWIGIDQQWGVAGLTASAGMAAWVEFTLLRRALNQRIGWTGLDRKFLGQLWGMAIVAAAVAFAIKYVTPHTGPRLQALMVIPAFGAVYLGLAYALDLSEFSGFIGILRRRLGMSASA